MWRKWKMTMQWSVSTSKIIPCAGVDDGNENGEPVLLSEALDPIMWLKLVDEAWLEENLVTQIWNSGSLIYDYKLENAFWFPSGIIGKVHTVLLGSPKEMGLWCPEPLGSDRFQRTLDCESVAGNFCRGAPYKANVYHPANWRQLVDYGCGTLGIWASYFWYALQCTCTDCARRSSMNCREPNDWHFCKINTETYEFPENAHLLPESLKWLLYDGPGAPPKARGLDASKRARASWSGACVYRGKWAFIIAALPATASQKIVWWEVMWRMDIWVFQPGQTGERLCFWKKKHYHQFGDALPWKMGKQPPFDYSAKINWDEFFSCDRRTPSLMRPWTEQ